MKEEVRGGLSAPNLGEGCSNNHADLKNDFCERSVVGDRRAGMVETGQLLNEDQAEHGAQ